jgi:hypothetical protein
MITVLYLEGFTLVSKHKFIKENSYKFILESKIKSEEDLNTILNG